MSDLIEVKPIDREFHDSRLRDFLPGNIIDVHTHVWVDAGGDASAGTAERVVSWPSRVARDNPIGDLLETYRLLLPGRAVTPVIFSSPTAGGDLDALNGYAAGRAREHALPALLLTRPEWSAGELEERIAGGGFLGVKPYLSFAPAYIPANEIRVFDFLPPHQLAALHRLGLIAMLHVPRPGRLRDPVNLAQMLEIEQRFPRVKLIIAHVGRAYCAEDVGNAFDVLARTELMSFDISANTNEEVFRRLIQAAGPRRIMFGSDMPILRMRMRRICEGGRYVNLVPRGMYGDVSDDPHIREVAGAEAARLTFFLYEEIDAFRRAAEAEGLTRGDVADVFHNNARRMIDSIASRGLSR